MSKWERFVDREPSGWRRESRDCVCPVCGKPDWCGVGKDGRFAVCMRIEQGAMKPTSNGGFLHRLDGVEPSGHAHGRGEGSPSRDRHCPIESVATTPQPVIDWPALRGKLSAAVMPASLAELSRELGVTYESLSRLGVGWQRSPRAWAFPMVGTDAKTCGIRLRGTNGYKWSVKGSRTGLFLPSDLLLNNDEHELLLIAEGPTDTAALLDLGFAVIGRPDCASRPCEIARFASRLTRDKVVVVADRDEPGQRGAKLLLQQLLGCSLPARSITPPEGVKDARAWIQQGATCGDVMKRIMHADLSKHGQRFYKSGGGQ